MPHKKRDPPANPPTSLLQVYNSSDTVYYKLAAKLQGQFQQLIHANVLYDEPLPE